MNLKLLTEYRVDNVFFLDTNGERIVGKVNASAAVLRYTLSVV